MIERGGEGERNRERQGEWVERERERWKPRAVKRRVSNIRRKETERQSETEKGEGAKEQGGR